MVRLEGFQTPTHSLGNCSSFLLSYRRMYTLLYRFNKVYIKTSLSASRYYIHLFLFFQAEVWQPFANALTKIHRQGLEILQRQYQSPLIYRQQHFFQLRSYLLCQQEITSVIAHVYNDIIFLAIISKRGCLSESFEQQYMVLSTDGNPSSLKFCIVTSRFYSAQRFETQKISTPCYELHLKTTAPGILRFLMQLDATKSIKTTIPFAILSPINWYYPTTVSSIRTIAKVFFDEMDQ